jgi:hypothetical protein
MLAACDSDPAGPHFGPPSAEPSAGRIPPGDNPLKLPVTATLRIVSVAASGDSMSIPGTSFKFQAVHTNFEIVVQDNGANDADARVGHYQVKLPLTDTYHAFVTSIPSGYATFGLTTSLVPREGMNVAFGSLVAKSQPILNITTLLESTRELTTGRTVRITSPTGFDATITDGGPTDLGAGPSEKPYLLDGKIRLRLNNQGEYTICEVNSLAAMPSCVKL